MGAAGRTEGEEKYIRGEEKYIRGFVHLRCTVCGEEEHPMRRLYRSKAASGYADAEYVKFDY